MPTISIKLTDLPDGTVKVEHDFQPLVGARCSAAQSAALDIINRTERDWGIKSPLRTTGMDINAAHRAPGTLH